MSPSTGTTVPKILRCQEFYPGQQCAVAIKSGIMLELGKSVIRQALQSLAQLRQLTDTPQFTIAANLSAPELMQPGMVEFIHAELMRCNLQPESLTIEITESELMVDLDRTQATLQALRAQGVRICLDDFGTAYSSLSWLRWLPIDTMKIDQSFVKGLPQDQRNSAIIKAIVDLAHALGHGLVAEGIETHAQLESLRTLGVVLGQGYLFFPEKSLPDFNADFADQISAQTFVMA